MINFSLEASAPDRVVAYRTLLAYRFGLPKSTLEIEHGLTESAEMILQRIARSEEHPSDPRTPPAKAA